MNPIIDKDYLSIYRSDDDEFFGFVIWILFAAFWAVLGLRVYCFLFGGND